MLTVILIIICLVKAKYGIDDETITRSVKIVSIIECSLKFLGILFKIAESSFTKADIATTILYIVILVMAQKIQKIKIAVLDAHFRGE